MPPLSRRNKLLHLPTVGKPTSRNLKRQTIRIRPPKVQSYLSAALPSVCGKTWRKTFPTKVIKRGFGGSQLADSTYYADRIVIAYQPRMIALYAGDNDLAAGKTPQQVFEDYKAFVSRARTKLPDVKIAYISIKPSLARVKLMEQMRVANELIRGYADKGKNLVFIDVFTPMLNQAGQPRPALFIQDGLHMNREGYDIWRKVIAPYLR